MTPNQSPTNSADAAFEGWWNCYFVKQCAAAITDPLLDANKTRDALKISRNRIRAAYLAAYAECDAEVAELQQENETLEAVANDVVGDARKYSETLAGDPSIQERIIAHTDMRVRELQAELTTLREEISRARTAINDTGYSGLDFRNDLAGLCGDLAGQTKAYRYEWAAAQTELDTLREAMRWRDAETEKPDQNGRYLIEWTADVAFPPYPAIGFWLKSDGWGTKVGTVIRWKPIVELPPERNEG